MVGFDSPPRFYGVSVLSLGHSPSSIVCSGFREGISNHNKGVLARKFPFVREPLKVFPFDLVM